MCYFSQLDFTLLAALKERSEARLSELSAEPLVGPGALPEGENALRQHVRAALDLLGAGLLEREAEVSLLLLAALAGEHLLLLGPPGTAKSELGRRLSVLTGGRYFERLLTRFSVPEELFGPLSLAALEQGKYVRETDGYLPTAECAFIDEVFKANSAILNALLTILNERLFDNGSERLRVPLLCLVGASNEMPESEELDALYDRFLLRRAVKPLSATGVRQLAGLASRGGTDGGAFKPGDKPLQLDELRACRAAALAAVIVPEPVVDLLCNLRTFLADKAEPPVYVSDRRFAKSVTLLQVAAHANGAKEVTPYDCLLLEFVLAQRPGDADKIRSFVLESIASDVALTRAELTFLGAFGRAMRASEFGADAQEMTALHTEVVQLANNLASLWQSLGATLEAQFPLLTANVWIGPAAAAQATQVLAPAMRDLRAKVEGVLREVLLLQSVIESEEDCSGALEQLLPRRLKQYQKGVQGA